MSMDELYFYDCNLNIKSFAGMLENPTQCYKFFWLDSIMQLVARGENEFTYGSNMRGSAEYRQHLAEVLLRREMRSILDEYNAEEK